MSILTQEEANLFINSLKMLLSEPALEFPNPGKNLCWSAKMERIINMLLI